MKKAKIQIKKEGDSTARIRMEDELSIQTVEDARENLKQVFENYQAFIFELDEVINLDLSYIQLLLSFRRSAEQAGKQVDFNINLPEELKTLIDKAGFKEILSVE